MSKFVPQSVGIVDNDTLLLLRQMLGFNGLKTLDIFLCHVGQQAQVRGIAPQADLQQFLVDNLLLFDRQRFDHGRHLASKLEDGRLRATESLDLLALKDVELFPMGGQAEELAHTTVEIALAKEPRGTEPAQSLKVFLDMAVPHRRVLLVIFQKAIMGRVRLSY